MIDCSVTVNFFSEKKRMCGNGCEHCKLSSANNGTQEVCRDYIEAYTKEAIAIVQEWSNAHPQRTMRDKFFEVFPNAPKSDDGTPEICPRVLGFKEQCDGDCKKCWDRPYIEKE